MQTPMDFTTINLEMVKNKMKPYDLPCNRRLQETPGNGCLLDPPGYPTYFTRCVFTPRGDHAAPGMVLSVGDNHYVVGDNDLKEFYSPLPFEHPRVQAWIGMLFGYFRRCYIDLSKPENVRRNVVELVDAEFGAPGYLHRAVSDIREVYPDYNPTEEPDGHWGYGAPGDWWERYAEPFNVNNCPGIHGHPHREDGWCQMCGLINATR